MKRIVAILLCFVMLFAFAGCGEDEKTDGKKESGRILFNNVKFDKYVKLGDYKNLTVDTTSKEYTEFYNSILKSDVEDNDFYGTKATGKIENGDIANIDYVGKKDGVAFQGGTASGQDLTIGSGTFIPGFEEGLIGVEIGSTVDLNLKFPDNYSNSPDLAGAAVVFTVKVNSAKSPLKSEEYYKKLGFSSVEAYNDDVKKRAVKNYLLNAVLSKVTVSDYPKADLDKLVKTNIELYDNMYKMQYGMDLESLLSASGQTMDSFKKSLTDSYVKPMMKEQMAFYNILDNEGLKVTSAEVNEKIDELFKEYNTAESQMTKEKFVNSVGKYYFETLVVSEKVSDYLYKNAEIK